jgi:hypothetical protein
MKKLASLSTLLALGVGTTAFGQSLGGTAPDALPGSLVEQRPLDESAAAPAEAGAVTPGLLPAPSRGETTIHSEQSTADDATTTRSLTAPDTSQRPTLNSQPAMPDRSLNAANSAANRSRADLPTPASGQAGDEQWRYKWHDDLWWYWTPQKNWRVLQAGRWVPYQAGASYAREGASVASASVGGTYVDQGSGYSTTYDDGAYYSPNAGYVSTYSTGPRRYVAGYRGGGLGGNYYNGYGRNVYYGQGYYPGYGRGFGGYNGYYRGGYGGFGPGYGGYYNSPGAVIGGTIGSSIGGSRGGMIGAGIGGGFGGRGW